MKKDKLFNLLKKMDLNPFTPYEILALIRKESSFNEKSYRHEPAYFKRYMLKHKDYWIKKYIQFYGSVPSTEDLSKKFAASYGLMQTMYSVAVGQGFHKKPEELFIPENSIRVGVNYLRYLYSRFPEIKISDKERKRFAIGAYNAGRGNINKMLVLARASIYGNGSYSHWVKLGRPIDKWMTWEYASQFLVNVTGKSNSTITLRHNELIFKWAAEYEKEFSNQLDNKNKNNVLTILRNKLVYIRSLLKKDKNIKVSLDSLRSKVSFKEIKNG